MRNPHQAYAQSLFRLAQPEGAVAATELTMPESEWAIDAGVDISQPNPVWGVLREDMAGRRVYLEHFSRSPSKRDLAAVLMKASWGLLRWLQGASRGEGRGEGRPRPPLMLALSVGRPRAALGFFPGFRAAEPDGIYRTGSPPEVILVDVKGLRPGPGTRFLRLFDHRPDAVARNVPDLFRDPAVDTIIKDRVWEAVTTMKLSLSEAIEKRLSWQEITRLVREEAREEGCEEGLEKGLEEARDAFLELAARLVGPDAAAELHAIPELGHLRDRLAELLARRPPPGAD